MFFDTIAGGQDNFATIKVNFKNLTLTLYDSGGNVIESFSVALSRTNPVLPVKGQVKKVELKVAWHPTAGTRQWYLENKKILLPEVLPYGHLLNAMGTGAISITFESAHMNPLIKIHGTNDSASIGKRITRGCIRMHNSDFLKLVKLMGNYRKVTIIFE